MKKRVLIVGFGAIGAFYGAKLGSKLDSYCVIALCRSNYDIVSRDGVTILSEGAATTFKPDLIVSSLHDINQPIDLIMIATKAIDNVPIAKLIEPVICTNTSILICQNGRSGEIPFKEQFPHNHIAALLPFIYVTQRKLGHIEHQAFGRVVIGPYVGVLSDTIVSLVKDLETVIPVKCVTNIYKEQWKKLIWNVGFNPLSLRDGGLTTVEVCERYLRELTAVMQEVQLLAKHDGYSIYDDFVKNTISETLKMTAYKTSMCIDYEMGRPCEVEAILGECLRFAEEKKVQVPEIETLYKETKALLNVV